MNYFKAFHFTKHWKRNYLFIQMPHQTSSRLSYVIGHHNDTLVCLCIISSLLLFTFFIVFIESRFFLLLLIQYIYLYYYAY